MNNIIPCRFCGGEGEATFKSIHNWVYCMDCLAQGPVELTEAEAIEAWNRPAPDGLEETQRAKAEKLVLDILDRCTDPMEETVIQLLDIIQGKKDRK